MQVERVRKDQRRKGESSNRTCPEVRDSGGKLPVIPYVLSGAKLWRLGSGD